MLTDDEKAAALEIVLAAEYPEDFETIQARLYRDFPTMQVEDMIALWREAGERQLVAGGEVERALDGWAEDEGGWGRMQ